VPISRYEANMEPGAAKGGDGGSARRAEQAVLAGYRLDEQVGFLLRRALQRHLRIFSADMPGGLTPRQFAALAKLAEVGPCSQNLLGRHTAMDAATIKGVVDRLRRAGYVVRERDPHDSRRRLVQLTTAGVALLARAVPAARRITERTLDGLDREERRVLIELLRRIG